MAASALFATWFGSETILGASSEFVDHGLLGVIEDPFGAALCLILVGIFFARPLYRLNINSFGDFYRMKFGKRVELIASLCIIFSYFTWIAAQLVALGIMANLLLGISVTSGVLICAAIVAIYTVTGGLWAVAITDTIQTVVIVVGLAVVAITLTHETEGFSAVMSNVEPGFYRFFPEASWQAILAYFAAWITIGLGSIPQQDIFQRVMAARTERIAVRSACLSGIMYVTIGLLPLYIGLCARYLSPDMVSEGNLQAVLPSVILERTGFGLQVMFFGALTSAILSTTSGAILAPATVLGENIVKPVFFNDKMEDKTILKTVRIAVIVITVVSLAFALYEGNIYNLVAQSSSLSLVSLFVPLVGGIYGKRYSESAALGSILGGMAVYIICESIGTETPALLYGLAASIIGWFMGGLLKRNEGSLSTN